MVRGRAHQCVLRLTKPGVHAVAVRLMTGRERLHMTQNNEPGVSLVTQAPGIRVAMFCAQWQHLISMCPMSK